MDVGVRVHSTYYRPLATKIPPDFTLIAVLLSIIEGDRRGAMRRQLNSSSQGQQRAAKRYQCVVQAIEDFEDFEVAI
jgi:hypothetical protein